MAYRPDHVILITALLFMEGAYADKKPASELKWDEGDEKGCSGNICIDADPPPWSVTDEKIDKADRKRRTDPFSAHNSDKGSDPVNMGVTLKLD